MRLEPITPEKFEPDIRAVHDEITNQIGTKQGQVRMINKEGALLGPFIPMLHYPQFGIPALRFSKALNSYATLPERIREIIILTVGGVLHARFELYAHEIMAATFGISPKIIATLATGDQPEGLNEKESISHIIARTLVKGQHLPDSTYLHAVSILGKDAVAEVIFLSSGYVMLATILNGFDVPAPSSNSSQENPNI